MRKESVIFAAAAGIMLFVHKPLTKSELNTVRMRLQANIGSVEKKIDMLGQQLQTLNGKMDRLDKRFSMLEKHFNIEKWQDSAEATDKMVPLKFEGQEEEHVHQLEVNH